MEIIKDAIPDRESNTIPLSLDILTTTLIGGQKLSI